MFLEAVFRNLIDFFENFWSGNFNKSGGQFFLGGRNRVKVSSAAYILKFQHQDEKDPDFCRS